MRNDTGSSCVDAESCDWESKTTDRAKYISEQLSYFGSHATSLTCVHNAVMTCIFLFCNLLEGVR